LSCVVKRDKAIDASSVVQLTIKKAGRRFTITHAYPFSTAELDVFLKLHEVGDERKQVGSSQSYTLTPPPLLSLMSF
jgi:hypothetical protein